ncbi:MAG: hypothetical protein BME93_02385 [Methanosarcinales archaeon Met12]|nr:MAG: hypothetical protein BME93_02385 [Methanosarcinales archaeon Met12]
MRDDISLEINIGNQNKTLILNSTNNSWVNNGLIALVQEVRKINELSEDETNIELNEGHILISSEDSESLYGCISQALHNIAAKGTYNFSTAFKIINKESNASYAPPKEYPALKGEVKNTMGILDSERKILKDKNHSDGKRQQIWKMRMNYLGSEDNYLGIGLNLKNHGDFKKLRELKDGNEICPVCGMATSTLIEMKQFFNPLSSEHHNNIVEGFSTDIRKKVKSCPKCIILSYFSLFDYYIPFFYIPGKETYLAIPNTVNIETLRIINNNLSLKGQYVDFSGSRCTSYSTNIRFLPHKSKSASMLTLLHNIKNRYSEKDPEELTISPFIEVTKEKFVDMVEWLFISKNSHSIFHRRANEKVYEILKPHKDPTNNDDVYLVPDVLCNFSFDIFDENEMERLYNGILKFDAKKISNGLFKMAKESISKSDRIRMGSRAQGSPPLYLFREVFLDKIMEVSTMLEENVRKACKEVAETIGKGFSEDVGMMTKFAYASSPEDFRSAMADASFRLAKISALNKDKNYWLDKESMEIFLGSLERAKFDDIKNYFVSFMSVYTLSENYKNRKTQGGK